MNTRVVVLHRECNSLCVLLVKNNSEYSLPTRSEFEKFCDQSKVICLQEVAYSSELDSDTVYYVAMLQSTWSCVGRQLHWAGVLGLHHSLAPSESVVAKAASLQILLGGQLPVYMKTCAWCGGYGSVFNRRFRDFENNFSKWSLPCPACKGARTIVQPKGWVPIEELKQTSPKHWRLM